MSRYDDIINIKRPELKKHNRASRESRAAQFGAFRALTGYEEAVTESARWTDDRLELSENIMEILNGKLQLIKEKLDDGVEVTITYFLPDNKKSGGKYVTATNSVIKIDEYERKVVLADKTEILIDMIVNIEGDIFSIFESLMKQI